MKVILYAAITANGMIGKKDGNSDFTSDADAISFNDICQKAGCAIMGRHTLENVFKRLPIDQWPNKNGLHIVLTSKKSLDVNHPNLHLAKSPQDALRIASTRGLKEVVVIGGGLTFGSFMKDNLVDEVFLDVEPLAFGEGMPLFIAGDFESKLDLIETKLLSPQTLQLHYRVKK
jgi:dihydrofolate reductase